MLQKKFLPELSIHVKDESCSNLMKTQLVITLSLMAHNNTTIQNMLCSDEELLCALFKMIRKTEYEYLCRLSCNLLVITVIDNIYAMEKVKGKLYLCPPSGILFKDEPHYAKCFKAKCIKNWKYHTSMCNLYGHMLKFKISF